MADIATLGLRVDASGATIAVDAFGKSLDAAAGKAKTFTATAAQTEAAWKRSGGSVSAFNTIIAQNKAAWEAANTVAAKSVTQMNEQARAALGLANAHTAAGRAMAMKELDAYKLDAALGKSTISVGKMREAVTSMTASVIQSAPGVAQLTSVLGAQALGGGVMVGVLAGIAAVTSAYQFLTRESRAAAEAQDEAVKSLLAWNKAQAFGAAGKFGSEVDESTKKLESQRRELENLRKLLPTSGSVVNAEDTGMATVSLSSVTKRYNELAVAVANGEAHVADVRKKAAAESVAETVRNTAALASAHKLSANEMKNALTLKAGLERQLGDLTRMGGSQSERAGLVALIKELNDGLFPALKKNTTAKEKDDAQTRRWLENGREAAAVAEMQQRAIVALRAAHLAENEAIRSGTVAMVERIRLKAPPIVTPKEITDLADAAQRAKDSARYAAEMRDAWVKGFEDIATRGTASFRSLFESVLSTFRSVMAVMEKEGRTGGLGYKLLGLGAAGISGGMAGYNIGQQTGSSLGGALGGAASGAVTGYAIGGPLGAAIGSIAGAAGGLLGAAQAQKEAAAALQRAADALNKDIATYVTGAGGDGKAAQVLAENQRYQTLVDGLREFYDRDKNMSAETRARYAAQFSDLAKAHGYYLEQIEKSAEALAAQAEAARLAAERTSLRQEQDAGVRLGRALGTPEIEAYARELANRREIEDLVTAGASAATIELTKLAQAAEAMASAAAAAAAATERAAAQQRAVEDINVELLNAKGETAAAADLEFQLAQQRRFEEAQKNQSAEYVEKLRELQQLQRDSRAAQQLIDSTGGGGRTVTSGATAALSAVSAVVTDRTALMLVDLTRSQVSLLQQIAINTGNGASGGRGGTVINVTITKKLDEQDIEEWRDFFVSLVDEGQGSRYNTDRRFMGSVAG